MDKNDKKNQEESNEITKLNNHVNNLVEERVNKMETDLMDKLQSTNIHTDTRASKWDDYKVGSGDAFTQYVAAAVRSVQKTGRVQNDLTSFTNDKEFAKRFLERSAPIEIGSDGGADVLDKPLYQEIQLLLRRKMILDDLGMTFFPMSTHTLDLPLEIASATYKYTNESAKIDESQYDWSQKQLVAKKLAGRVAVSNEFLASDPLATAGWIADRMLEDFAQAMQTAVIDGMPSGPEDLFTGIASANKFELTTASGQSSDLDEYLTKIDDAVEKVTDQNVREGDIKALTSVRHRNFLRRQRMTGGGIYFPEIRDERFQGYDLHVTNDIGNSYDDSGDGDSDETRIYVGDFSAMAVGILNDVKLDYSPHAAFANDQGMFRVTGLHDSVLMRPDRLAVLSTDISK